MHYEEVHMNLFDNTNEYAYVQCLSADFATRGAGAGIAVEFNNRFDVKRKLSIQYPEFYDDWIHSQKSHACIVAPGDYLILNLITKERCYYKPTIETMRGALEDMKVECLLRGVRKVAMPKIGCGLDKLHWDDVKNVIFDVFADTDIEIKVCFY